MNKDNLVSLHVHDEHSNLRLLDSTNKIEDMILHVANNLGQGGMALTNHETIAGHPEFLQTVERLKESKKIPQDWKPILGNEIYLVDEEDYKQACESNKTIKYYHFLLLAKNKKGHDQLRQLSARAWHRAKMIRGMERTPTFYRDMEEVLLQDKGNIIGSTACLGSRFSRLALQFAQMEQVITHGSYFDSFSKQDVTLPKQDAELKLQELRGDIDDFLNWCLGMFGDDFYIEVQPSMMQDQVMYNKVAQRIANAYNIPMIVTTDAHYLTKNDRAIHEAFLTSDEDGNGNREVADFYSTTYFFTSEEIHDMLDYLGYDAVEQMINNTQTIANMVEEYSLAHNQVIPKIPLPQEEEWSRDGHEIILQVLNENPELYPSIYMMINSSEQYDRYLVNRCFNGLLERVPQEDYREYLLRLNLEFEEIIGVSKAKNEPISSYFITMQKIIDIIWETGSIVGTGRGSAGCFLTNYLLQIVQMNPMRQGVKLEHWRFLHKSKIEIPDIDIDLSSHKRDIVFKALQDYFQSIGGDIIRVCTFGTETAKSAIQTAVRGLGINSDVGLYLSSLMPVERGQVRSLKDAYYGNEEKGWKPVTELVNQISQYPRLLDVALGVEGLISRRGVHACGSLVVNEPITKYNSIMKAPNGEITTQYPLAPSEYTGLIKYDLLNTKTCGMIQICMEMLIQYGHMEWQGSLRKTYDKYLHPDVIDSTSYDMWERLCRGELISAFQMDGDVGENAVRMIQPHSILETTNANTVMRLMCEGEEQPLQKYARYKHDIQEWYNDMINYGLNDQEIAILEPLLLPESGVCGTQESMMALVMNKNIANFDVPQANKIRKVVAKKKMRDIPVIKELYYELGHKVNARQIFLDYIWNEQISLQLGYSFCLAHSLEYTWILVQQLNLIHYYPSIYWNTSVLLVESGAVAQDTVNEEDDKKEKTTNYGVVASAISNLQNRGIVIALPDINKADVGFIPNESNNSIMFGMKGISTINNETAKIIMDNRPYANLLDFHTRLVENKREITLSTGKKQMKSLVTTSQTLNLIKGGAFDELENKPREEILASYLRLLNPPKTRLTASNIASIIEMGMIPPHLTDCVKHYNFKEFIKTLPKHKDETSKTITWYVIDCENDEMTDYTTNYLMEHFGELVEDRDYYYDESGFVHLALGTSRKGSFEALHKDKLQPLTQWLNTKDCIDLYNHITFEEIKRNQMRGNLAKWEMESMNYYYTQHELDGIDQDLYSVANFNELPDEPVITGFTQHNGVQYPRFELHRIAGTVLDRDRNKHTVTLLTQYGVVPVKFYGGQFSFYDKTLSMIDENTGKKVTVEDGWFKRGSLLLISGFRRGQRFSAKRYSNSIYQHAVTKITNVLDDGVLELQTERAIID